MLRMATLLCLVPLLLGEAHDAYGKNGTRLLSLSRWREMKRAQTTPAEKKARWDIYNGSWKRMLITAYDAAEGVMHANDADLCQPPEFSDDESADASLQEILALPVYVLNLPTKPERRAHMSCFLQFVGFHRLEFPPVVDGRDLKDAGASSTNLKKSHGCNQYDLLSCLACSLSHLSVHALALESGHDRYLILEDDLMLGGSVQSVRRRLAAAVAELPQAFDMLYLEACFEDCSNVRFASGYHHIGKAHMPLCAAAILFSAKGARRIRKLTGAEDGQQPWGSIDDMYSTLIDGRHLDAYIMAPPIFYQVLSLQLSLLALLVQKYK
jgi:GR25 family glycosyltransferase involved in LPS biosynthesis